MLRHYGETSFEEFIEIIMCYKYSKSFDGSNRGVLMWRNTEIDLFSQRNSEKLYEFWRILADFGKQEYWWTQRFYILKDGIRQSSNSTDTDIA